MKDARPRERSMRWFGGMVLAASLMVVPASAQQDDQNTRQQVEQMAVAYAAAIGKQDAAGIVGLYTKDGVLVTQAAPGAKTVKSGPQEIEQYVQGSFKAGINHEEITVDQVSPLGTDAVISMGEYQVSGQGQNGAIKFGGHWTAVYVREGGAWKIRLLTAVPNLPPPPSK